MFCGNQSLSECLRKTIKAFDFKVHIGLLILFDPHHNVTQNHFRGNKKFVLNIAHYDASSFLQGLSKLWRTGSLSSSRSKLWSPDFSRVSGDPVENVLISHLVCRARLWDSLKCFPVLYCTICIKLITCSFFWDFHFTLQIISYLLLGPCRGALLEVCGGSLPSSSSPPTRLT